MYYWMTEFYKQCKKADISFVYALYKFIVNKLKGRKILMHQRTIIKGAKNIETRKGILRIGITYIGFVHKKDYTYLNIQGKLIVEDSFSIGRGCRLDIAKGAYVKLGAHSFINPFTTLIIKHGLNIGENCSIGWNCQFLDDDFHELQYENKKEISTNKITISDNVWIGSQVAIYKGTLIARGSVIASNSVVKGIFSEENVLIAGNPAKIIKRNVKW